MYCIGLWTHTCQEQGWIFQCVLGLSANRRICHATHRLNEVSSQQWHTPNFGKHDDGVCAALLCGSVNGVSSPANFNSSFPFPFLEEICDYRIGPLARSLLTWALETYTTFSKAAGADSRSRFAISYIYGMAENGKTSGEARVQTAPEEVL